MLVGLGAFAGLTWPYFVGLVAAAGFAIYQQHIIRDREPMACFHAFLNNNWFGGAVFVGLMLNYLV